MGTLKQNSFEGTIKSIINDVYAGMQNAGLVSDYIQKSTGTSDFELTESLILRVKETKNTIYYNIFRSK